MLEGWKTRRVQDLCIRVTSGGTPSRARSDYFAEPGAQGVPWLKTKELDDRLVYETEEWISAAGLNQSAAKVLPVGTVVMAMYGATVGKLGQLAIPMACNQAVCAMIADATEADARFLYYRLLHDRADLVNLAVGSAQQNLSGKIIGAYEVSVPDVAEQRQIAGVLGALDDLIEANEQVMANVLALSRIYYARLIADAIDEVALGTLMVANRAQVKPGTTHALRYTDIASLSDGRVSWGDPMTWDEAPSRARRATAVGDTLWSCVRPNLRAHGLVNREPADVVVSTGIVTLTPSKVGPAFLFATTDSEEFIERLSRLADGGAYPAVRPEAFASAVVPLPDKSALDAFEAVMWPLWLAAGELEEENLRLRATRDALLPLLMSGKVRAGEVDA